MRLTLKIWRQDGKGVPGRFETHELDDVSEDSSFLEMLDVLNESLEEQGRTAIAFDHDCREGICGTCSVMINGQAHGPRERTTACQLHMREFSDGETLIIEPWRSQALPVLKDLTVDRAAFDRIIQSGGYITVDAGSAPEANLMPIPEPDAESAFDAAACIGCAACVAQCPNGAAHLFTSAKIGHLGILPQGQAERFRRVVGMVEQMESEGFGGCSNHRECEAVCPKGIGIEWIARMNRDYLRARLRGVGSS